MVIYSTLQQFSYLTPNLFTADVCQNNVVYEVHWKKNNEEIKIDSLECGKESIISVADIGNFMLGDSVSCHLH